MTPAIAFYDVVLSVHILAVVVAFGATFAYPVLDAVARRTSVAELATLHRFQTVLTRRVISPAMGVILLAGVYLTLDRWDFAEPWIGAAFAILIVLFGMVGGLLAPTERRCAQLAQRDADAGQQRSAEYDDQARLMARYGAIAAVLVIVAIFVMTTKPGA
jgi:uncharacterized membrane protein